MYTNVCQTRNKIRGKQFWVHVLDSLEIRINLLLLTVFVQIGYFFELSKTEEVVRWIVSTMIWFMFFSKMFKFVLLIV